MHRVITDIAVRGVKRGAIKRVEMRANFAGELFQVAIIVITQGRLRYGAAIAGFLHQRAIVGDAVIARLFHMQFFEVAVHPGIRTSSGQHHVDTLRTRLRDSVFYAGRNGVIGQQKRPVHINCDEFYRHRIFFEVVGFDHANAIPLTKVAPGKSERVNDAARHWP